MSVRVLYTDIDGTLVGPLGNLFWDETRAWTLAAADALVRAHREGLEIVALSGRDRRGLGEVGRLLGLSTWFCELGGIRVYERGTDAIVDHGAFPGSGRPAEVLRPAMEAMVAAHAGEIEEHTPWNDGREVSLMVRGHLDIAAADAWLAAHDLAWAEIVDNGVIPRAFPGLPRVERVRAYHFAPRGISKRDAIVADQHHRGIDPSQCAAIGDAAADLACHDAVARCFVVRNALAKDPGMAEAIAAAPNTTITTHGHGAGFAEAVATLLAG